MCVSMRTARFGQFGPQPEYPSVLPRGLIFFAVNRDILEMVAAHFGCEHGGR